MYKMKNYIIEHETLGKLGLAGLLVTGFFEDRLLVAAVVAAVSFVFLTVQDYFTED